MNKISLLWKNQSEITRKTLFLLFIAAVWMVSPAIGIILLIFPSVRNSIIQAFSQGLSSETRFLWFPMIIPIAVFAYTHPVPTDDLLKHLVSGVYHYHYRTMFWGSPRLMAGDLYIGFDHVASFVHSFLPSNLAFIPFQALLVIGFSVSIPLIIHRQMPDLPPYLAISITLFMTVLVWLLPAFTGRLISGRPEDDLALWGAMVFLLSRKKPGYTVIWFLFGLLSAPMYWLSCVYFPMVFLMPTTFKKRLMAFSSLCVVFLAFWLTYSQGHWFSWLISLHTDIGDRFANVAEDISAIPLIESPSGLALLILSISSMYYLFSKSQTTNNASRQDSLSFASALSPEGIVLPAIIFSWLMIPDMIRYVDSLAPIAVVMLARSFNRLPFLRSLPISFRPISMAIGLLSCVLLVSSTFHPSPMPDMHIPHYKPGQKVLTFFSAATYDTLYENPGIMVAPAMELGMTRRSIQKASFYLEKGLFDCNALHRWHVLWVATPKTDWDFNNPPACAHLLRLNSDGMSLWQIN